MRDEPYRPGSEKLTPVEAVFVGTAIVASIAMLIWFFAFAGSPLPTYRRVVRGRAHGALQRAGERGLGPLGEAGALAGVGSASSAPRAATDELPGHRIG